jgi:hypothetical protein
MSKSKEIGYEYNGLGSTPRGASAHACFSDVQAYVDNINDGYGQHCIACVAVKNKANWFLP